LGDSLISWLVYHRVLLNLARWEWLLFCLCAVVMAGAWKIRSSRSRITYLEVVLLSAVAMILSWIGIAAAFDWMLWISD
jgi:NhaP-type Na+/H+ or K+/H+ antiporter